MSDEKFFSDILIKIDSIESAVLSQKDDIKLLNFNLKLLLNKMNKNFSSENIKQNVSEINEEVPKQNKEKIEESKSLKEVTVKQKIKYSDDSPVILAKIRILDLENKELKSTRTNPTGSWVLILEPGNYQVHIVKERNSNHPMVDRLFKLTVPNDKKSFILPDSKG